MTADDIAKATFGAVLGVVVLAVSWLISTVLKGDKEDSLQAAKIKTLEARMEHLENTQLTGEQVREAIEKALAQRDERGMERRIEWEKRFTLEVRQAIHDEVRKLLREEMSGLVKVITRRHKRHSFEEDEDEGRGMEAHRK